MGNGAASLTRISELKGSMGKLLPQEKEGKAGGEGTEQPLGLGQCLRHRLATVKLQYQLG